jgi:hypothetical protein
MADFAVSVALKDGRSVVHTANGADFSFPSRLTFLEEDRRRFNG